jgi:tetratricopeptide (TPR) repeat protein
MNRPIVAAVGVTALVTSVPLVWLNARQEGEYRRLIAAGDAAIARDQTFEAIETFSGALTLKPDSTIARLKRGDTYRRRGEFASAVRDLGEASALDPASPRPLELLGDARAAMGQHEQAARDYERFLELDDRAPRVVYKLGLAYYRAGHLPRAIETLRRAVGLDQRLVEAHYMLGLCLKDTEPAQAERALLRAIEVDPAFMAAREELVVLYTASNRAPKALEQLEALSALEPMRPERLVRVGLAQAGMGRRDAAVVTLNRAAERNPDAEVVYAALGRVWLEAAESQGDPIALKKAIEALAPAAAWPTASSSTLALYGRALQLSGDPAAAERALRRATLQFPVEPAAFAYLADAARQLGHTQAARDASARHAALVAD